MQYTEFYRRSIEDPQGFWQEQSKQIDWYRQPEEILAQDTDSNHRWFADGLVNMSHLCLDQQVAAGRGKQTAIIYDSPVTNTVTHISYKTLLLDVARFAAGLKNLGVGVGDTVVIYMPMIPQALIAMLACARIGAIHSVVFGGFAAHELALRIDDARPKVLIAASYGIEFGRKVPYKVLVEQALQEAQHRPDYQVYYRREEGFDNLGGRNDMDFEALMQCGTTGPVAVPSTHPLYILYTSGTTGRPKGIVRDTGGYATALRFSMQYFYGAQPGEVFFAGSDIGWVVGHSYIVYAPLLYGCTTVLFEGKPVRTPDAGVFWRMVAQHKINHLFTAPTAIRAIRKEDSDGALLAAYDISSLKQLFLAGERCDPATYHWIKDLLQVPVIDHWWQTESGWPMLGSMRGLESPEPRAGAAGMPVCGFDVQVLDAEGREVPEGTEGAIVVRLPLPPGCLQGLWRNQLRYQKSYMEQFPGYYLTGDGGYRDAQGYCYVMGRMDDVINVSGHRLSTGEMEELVATHPAVAECTVIGIADELRGQRPLALVVLKDGKDTHPDELESALVALIREKIGPVAYFKNAVVVKRLPKTRSGKILRKTLCQIADGVAYAIPSTIEDPSVLNEIALILHPD